jgi:acyl-[acyl-carrier-protein]-phospholipid O-acyltransferase / long-chain-fatty-acid--[acyl-carrier-protein] ligase
MLRAFVRTLSRWLFRVEVRGEVQAADKLLIVSNHQSFLDVILLAAFLPLRPVWLVHTTIAKIWYFKILLRFFPHLIVDTASPWAIKTMVGMVESGHPMLIFPEGRITTSGGLMKIYDGPAFVAAKTGASVVPIAIDGAVYSLFSRMSGEFPVRRFPRIRITIRPPRTIPMPEGRTAKIRRRLASETLRHIMQETLCEGRPRQTLFDAFLDAVVLHGRGRGLLEDTNFQEQSFGGVLKASLALGRILSKFTSEGEHVGLLMPNVGTTVSLILGACAFRRVPAMLNYTAGLDGMQNACRIAAIRVVVTSRAFLERSRLAAAAEKLQDVRLVCLEDLRAGFGFRDKLWLMLWALRFPRRARTPARPEDPAVILFTSGSEGKPKGVVLSHAAILANIAQLRSIIDVTAKDKFMTALPLFHAFGLTVGTFLPLVTGSRLFLYPSPLHYRMVPEMTYDRDCTILFATNTFLANYAKFAHPYDFRSVRYAGSGAEKLSEEVRRTYLEKFGIRILEGYGATECAPVLSLNTPLGYQAGTVGELLPQIEYRIEPVAGIEGGGLLHVRGPNLMLGYLRDDRPGVVQPLASVFGEGWYNTGDIVSIDESRFVTILGRMKRFAKVAGEMVSLDLPEKIATEASPRFLHASASRTEPGRGEIILLFTQDPSLRRDQLVAAARRMGSPEMAVPRRIYYLPKLPLLGNGKTDYMALNQMADEMRKTETSSRQ